MTLKRTTVYVDAEDLRVIKESAAREGVSEAEIIRQAVHRAALARKTWDEPFFARTYPPLSGTPTDTTEATEAMWEEKAQRYRDGKGDAA
ncbi:CopG family transcriptional regulator [Streptomyces sp. NPDC006422]|uniref:ribbon-helix-helix domain-containing protein n=1 Tax=unclassified Streptomyces TaxID=2593676 RepID=UPI0033BF1CDB